MMKRYPPPSDWATAAAEYMSRNQQCLNDDGTWDHTFMTAYEISCEALAALGYAKETDWGAMPFDNPKLPNILPRWDDVCVAVLRLADQRGGLQFRMMDGGVYRRPQHLTWTTVSRRPTPPPPLANIGAANGLGPAYAQPDVEAVLRAVGVTMNEKWSEAAETILWRLSLPEWALNFEGDDRFASAVERAFTRIPDDIGTEIMRAATITDDDVAEALAKSLAWLQQQRAKYGPNARLHAFTTAEQARRSVEGRRRNDLDWLFFRRWRLSEGWLSAYDAKQALGIFHDPLAIAMRRAVMTHLYPHLPFLAER